MTKEITYIHVTVYSAQVCQVQLLGIHEHTHTQSMALQMRSRDSGPFRGQNYFHKTLRQLFAFFALILLQEAL